MSGNSIRQHIRQQRRLLSSRKQVSAAENIASLLTSLAIFKQSKRVAAYLPTDGEIDPSIVMSMALALNKQCFLPALHPLKINRLYFLPYKNGDTLCPNRYGIFEPPLNINVIVPTWSLDIILLPLVAFDLFGNRLGMGAGFYDKTLAFTRNSNRRRPLLVGIAHDFQEVENIQKKDWDIPLQYIVTDQRVITPHNGN